MKCLKSLGTLPIVPLFQILHDYDLSDDEDDVSFLFGLTCPVCCMSGLAVASVFVIVLSGDVKGTDAPAL